MKKTLIKSQLFKLLILLLIITSCQETKIKPKTEVAKTRTIAPDNALKLSTRIRSETAVSMADNLVLELWASDSIVADPIAISIDPQGGIYYTEGNRIEHSEFDIRGHRDWMTESISWESVEDRRAFIRKTFTDDSEPSLKYLKDLNEDGVLNWKDLTVEEEEVWRVFDSSGNGYANKAQLYISDFHEEVTDLANGIEFYDDEVYIGVGPDLWKTSDKDHNGVADDLVSLAHGFAVHIGFGAHGMSGVKMGPDGRIWWGIGDIGMNVVDQEGKRWKYPNRGVIVRCETDGSNFEVFSSGHRNTHEFVFDEYGNLITIDNDGDHRGERERLVYIVNGSDSGWRINWQFGKYTDPDNNSYKVWMDEKLHIPRWDGQAAYIVPPIVNYVNGPTGMAYNPGTALGEEWDDHFFIAEFRGTAANSPIHAFTLKPEGAGFMLDKTTEFVKGLLPTGMDFGPDGALYFADWIDGWGAKHQGRIWKIDVEKEFQHAIRKETETLIQADFSTYKITELSNSLLHPDRRVRQKAQFELVKRGEDGFLALKSIASTSDNQLARIHGLWGMSQFARKDISLGEEFIPFLSDSDYEIIAQAAKQIGDVRYKGAGDKLSQLVNHNNPRIRFFATEALGRTADNKGINAIIKMLIDNDDKDVYLRHAGALALSRIGDKGVLTSLKDHSSRSLRIAAVVALRRMQSPAVVGFLNDKDEYVVTEAARAINDDWSIEAALPSLASLIKENRYSTEALIRRIINANLRVGKDVNLVNLLEYAKSISAPPLMRAEAIAAAMTWAKPSVLDRVDGRYRGKITRDEVNVKDHFSEYLPVLLKDKESSVLISSIKAASRLQIKHTEAVLYDQLVTNTEKDVRSEALIALNLLGYNNIKKALELGLADNEEGVRSVALELIPGSGLEEKNIVQLFQSILDDGTISEQQAVISSLVGLKGSDAIQLIESLINDLIAENIKDELKLDIINAVEQHEDKDLLTNLEVYKNQKSKEDPIYDFEETLYGGDPRRGRDIFYNNEAAQCVRCHAIWEWGGDAGPGLHGLADRITPNDILESMIEPSAKIAKGFGVASLELESGEKIAGVVESEDSQSIVIKLGDDTKKSINKINVIKRQDIPSSMPSVKKVLSKMQIRDLVAFLTTLHQDEN